MKRILGSTSNKGLVRELLSEQSNNAIDKCCHRLLADNDRFGVRDPIIDRRFIWGPILAKSINTSNKSKVDDREIGIADQCKYVNVSRLYPSWALVNSICGLRNAYELDLCMPQEGIPFYGRSHFIYLVYQVTSGVSCLGSSALWPNELLKFAISIDGHNTCRFRVNTWSLISIPMFHSNFSNPHVHGRLRIKRHGNASRTSCLPRVKGPHHIISPLKAWTRSNSNLYNDHHQVFWRCPWRRQNHCVSTNCRTWPYTRLQGKDSIMGPTGSGKSNVSLAQIRLFTNWNFMWIVYRQIDNENELVWRRSSIWDTKGPRHKDKSRSTRIERGDRSGRHSGVRRYL